mgnify:CR=1 FL=1
MLYLEYPLDTPDNHLYIKTQSGFTKRCGDGSVTKDGSEVVELTEDEFTSMIQDSKYDICPQCLRYTQGIII